MRASPIALTSASRSSRAASGCAAARISRRSAARVMLPFRQGPCLRRATAGRAPAAGTRYAAGTVDGAPAPVQGDDEMTSRRNFIQWIPVAGAAIAVPAVHGQTPQPMVDEQEPQ